LSIFIPMNDFEKLIDEAIRLELNVGELYLLFYRLFPEDETFWWKIAIEEENHAALLKTVRQMGSIHVALPMDLLPAGIEELRDSNRLILQALEDFEKRPDRDRAFHLAHQIENSAGELHYNMFMKDAPPSTVTDMFKKLNGHDLDHAQRIIQYMADHNIPRAEPSDTGL
jgi:hypothetical protein